MSVRLRVSKDFFFDIRKKNERAKEMKFHLQRTDMSLRTIIFSSCADRIHFLDDLNSVIVSSLIQSV